MKNSKLIYFLFLAVLLFFIGYSKNVHAQRGIVRQKTNFDKCMAPGCGRGSPRFTFNWSLIVKSPAPNRPVKKVPPPEDDDGFPTIEEIEKEIEDKLEEERVNKKKPLPARQTSIEYKKTGWRHTEDYGGEDLWFPTIEEIPDDYIEKNVEDLKNNGNPAITRPGGAGGAGGGKGSGAPSGIVGSGPGLLPGSTGGILGGDGGDGDGGGATGGGEEECEIKPCDDEYETPRRHRPIAHFRMPAKSNFSLKIGGFEPNANYEFRTAIGYQYGDLELGPRVLDDSTPVEYYQADQNGDVEIVFTMPGFTSNPSPLDFMDVPMVFQYSESLSGVWSPAHFITAPFPGLPLLKYNIKWDDVPEADSYYVIVRNVQNDFFAFETYVDQYKDTSLGLEILPGEYQTEVYALDAAGEILKYDIEPYNVSSYPFYYRLTDYQKPGTGIAYNFPVFINRYFSKFSDLKKSDKSKYLFWRNWGLSAEEIDSYDIQLVNSQPFPSNFLFTEQDADPNQESFVGPGGTYTAYLFNEPNITKFADVPGHYATDFSDNFSVKNYIAQFSGPLNVNSGGGTPIYARVLPKKDGQPAKYPIKGEGSFVADGEFLDYALTSLTWNRIPGATDYFLDITDKPARFKNFPKLFFENPDFESITSAQIAQKEKEVETAQLAEFQGLQLPKDQIIGGISGGINELSSEIQTLLPKSGQLTEEQVTSLDFVPRGPFYFRTRLEDKNFVAKDVSAEKFAKQLKEARVSRSLLYQVTDPNNILLEETNSLIQDLFGDDSKYVKNYDDFAYFFMLVSEYSTAEEAQNYLFPFLTDSEVVGLTVETKKELPSLDSDQIRITTNVPVEFKDFSYNGAKISITQPADKLSAVLEFSGESGVFLLRMIVKGWHDNGFYMDASPEPWRFYVSTPAVQNLNNKIYYEPEFLALNEKYYWRVVAYNEDTGQYGESWSNIEEISTDEEPNLAYLDQVSERIKTLEAPPKPISISIKEKLNTGAGTIKNSAKNIANFVKGLFGGGKNQLPQDSF